MFELLTDYSQKTIYRAIYLYATCLLRVSFIHLLDTYAQLFFVVDANQL